MRLVRCISLSMAFGLFTAGCGHRDGGPPVAPPPSVQPQAESGPAASVPRPERLVYPNDPSVYTKGVPILANTPYNIGGPVTAYRVNPPLPPGLELNPGTGVISGTPTALAAAAGYEVTAMNPAGSTSVTLTITVNDQAPGARPVVTLPAFVTEKGAGLTASTQDQGAGAKYDWTLRGGTITSGQGTPAIIFTAGAPGALTAAVTVANTGGSVAGGAEAVVVPVPDATLTVPVAVQTLDGSKTARVPQQAGMTYTWTIIPGTSTATITSGQGSNAVRFTAGAAPGSFQIQVQVQNQAGNYLTTSATIKVQTGY